LNALIVNLSGDKLPATIFVYYSRHFD